MKIILKTFLIATLAISLNCEASWYTVQGEATIISNDVKAARDEAINDGIKNALLQAGASVSVEQRVVNGNLVTDSMRLNANNEIKHLTILNEQRTSNSVNVTLRIYIDDNNISSCKFSQKRKPVLPIKIRFLDEFAHQGSVGLEGIEEVINLMLYSELSKSPSLQMKPQLNVNVHLSPNANDLTTPLQESLNSLGMEAHSQYIIYGSINSVATSEVGSNFLTKLMYTNTRSIDFSLSIYDIYNRSIIYTKNFQGESDWDFKQGENVDLRSNRFRNSSYGAKLKQLIELAAEDLLMQLNCKPLITFITRVDGDAIFIGQGKRSNIEIGDRFSIQHRSKFSGAEGQDYIAPDPKTYVYEVVAVYPEGAKLKPHNYDDSLINPRIYDLVTLL